MAEDGEKFRVLSAAYFFAAVSLAILLTLLVWASTYGYLAYIDRLDLVPYLPGSWLYFVLIGASVLAWWLSRRAFRRARDMTPEEARGERPDSES
jgi:membrane protein implicated in regulation of membrane protease activity